MNAFEQAQKWYAEHRYSLLRDLAHYHRHGIVITRPDVFVMAKLIKHEGELTWFIKFGSGDIISLTWWVLSNLPCDAVRKIAWHRHDKEQLHSWSIDHFIKTSFKLKGQYYGQRT